jgi:hypothetical protein
MDTQKVQQDFNEVLISFRKYHINQSEYSDLPSLVDRFREKGRLLDRLREPFNAAFDQTLGTAYMNAQDQLPALLKEEASKFFEDHGFDVENIREVGCGWRVEFKGEAPKLSDARYEIEVYKNHITIWKAPTKSNE